MDEFDFAFDLSMFDDTGYTATSPRKIQQTSPAKRKVEAPKRELKVLKDTPRVKKERQFYKEVEGIISTVKIMAVALVAILVIGSLVYQRVAVNDLDREISKIQVQLDEAKSENVRLKLAREAMITPTIISEYAENKGMIRRDSYTINYFDLSGKDVGYAL